MPIHFCHAALLLWKLALMNVMRTTERCFTLTVSSEFTGYHVYYMQKCSEVFINGPLSINDQSKHAPKITG